MHMRLKNFTVRNLTKMLAVLLLGFMTFATIAAPSGVAHADDADSVQGKTYRIATDTTFAPFEFREKGELTGIDMDLIHTIAKDEGFKVSIASVGFSAALQALSSKQADAVISGMTITDERKLVYDFSYPYFQSGIQLAVAKNNTSIKSYDDLKGKKVLAKIGSESEIYAKKIQAKYGFQLQGIDQTATMVESVKANQADAMLDDAPVLNYGIEQGNGLRPVGKAVPQGYYGFAVAKDSNKALLAAFNHGLYTLMTNGKYVDILSKYIGKPAAEAQLQANLKAYEKANQNGEETSKAQETTFMQRLTQAMPALMIGLKNTLLITLLSFAIALTIGVLFGILRLSRNAIISGFVRVYVSVFRGTPLLVWAFFFYFGVPQLINHPINIWVAGALTLSLNSGAYLVEIIRGAIESVDDGQMEGARSLGLSYSQAMRKVILPQAFRIASPSVINQLVIMIKDSSLLLAIGFGELLYQAQQIYAANFRVSETLLMVGVIYFIAITILTCIANILDKNLNL